MSTPSLIPVKEWATKIFGEHAPHINTLYRWISEGRINPPAKKCGKGWFVRPHAEYTGD